MLRHIRLITIAVIAAAISLSHLPTSFAGNHQVIHPIGGYSIGWEESDAIPYWIDRGGLGVLNETQARVLVDAMMSVWAGVETARVGFAYQGELPEDVTEENIAEYLAMTTCGGSNREDIPEDVVPVIFDADGKIVEYLVGMGSATEVGGLSTLRCFAGTVDNPKSIYQGMVIINGQFVDGKDVTELSPSDLSINGIAGVILHELGHLLGVDHTALNEEIYDGISNGDLLGDYSKYLPVMFPTVLRSANSATTLHPDDISAISTLYPAPGYLSVTGDIRGEILKKNMGKVRKVNVIARLDSDPLCEAVAAVTGRRCVPLLDDGGRPNFNVTECASYSMYGDYAVEGLLPGGYTVEVEELERGWVRNGMYPVAVDNDLPGDAEFYNAGDAAEESPYTTTLVSVGQDQIIEGIDIVLNSSSSADGQLKRIPLDEFEEGPGTRCLNDLLNYADVINDADADFSVPILDRSVSDGGGCQLVGGTKGAEFFSIIFIALTLVLLRAASMRRIYKALLIGAIFLLPAAADASSVVPVSLEEMTLKAGKIFYGRCIDAVVVADEQGLVSTVVTYEVKRAAKGVDSERVAFKVFGVATTAKDGLVPSTVTGGMNFIPGREEVLFLYKESPWGYTAPIGLWQGVFPVAETPDGPRVHTVSTGSIGRSGTGIKAATGNSNDRVTTPDDFLDKVENILAEHP